MGFLMQGKEGLVIVCLVSGLGWSHIVAPMLVLLVCKVQIHTALRSRYYSIHHRLVVLAVGLGCWSWFFSGLVL